MRATVCANLASNLASRANLLRALQDAGYELTALGRPDSGVDRLKGDYGIPFIPVYMNNTGMNALDDVKTFFSFLSIYRKLTPDIALHFNSKPDIYGSMAAGILGIPSICNITGLGTVYSGSGGIVRFLVNALYRMAFSGKRTFVFFQNSDDLSLFVELRVLTREKAGLLPGSGVDITRFSPVDRSTFPSRQNPGLTRFLFVGRMLVSKGVTDFIDAARIVKASYPLSKFCMVGETGDSGAFVPRGTIDAAVRDGLVEYPGNVANVRDYISDADCVVLPSYYREGVPRSLLEAASMATPLIACDSVGTREPVRDGENGYLCACGSPEDLAEKMVNFICLPNPEKNAMGERSRMIAERDFSDSIVTARYLDVIKKRMA